MLEQLKIKKRQETRKKQHKRLKNVQMRERAMNSKERTKGWSDNNTTTQQGKTNLFI